MYFKTHLKHTASCVCDIMGKSKEISQDIRKRIVDFHKSGSSLGTISRCLKVPRSSVQIIIRNYKHHGNVQQLYCSGWVLCLRDECALVQNVRIKPRTKAKDHVKMLAETGKRVSLSTVQSRTDMGWKSTQLGRSLYSKSDIKKPDYSLQMHTGTKILMSCGLMKLKFNCLAIMSIATFGGKRGSLQAWEHHPNCVVRGWHHVVGVFCCRRE